jgi:hypothetical protein
MNHKTDNGEAGREGDTEATDRRILDSLQSMFRTRDPAPPELGARVRFAFDLAGIERELATEVADLRPLAAVRGGPPSRTVTFECGPLTVAVMITQAGDLRRLDGWVAPERPLMVELRQGGKRLYTRSDRMGRFVFSDVSAGATELAIRPEPGDADERPIVIVRSIEL